MDDKKGYLDDTHNFVIPARDAGIQEFYQVGEHKSYVKMHHFYGKLDPSVKHWDDKKRGYWDDKRRDYWDDKRRGYLHDTLHRLLNCSSYMSSSFFLLNDAMAFSPLLSTHSWCNGIGITLIML